MRYVAHATVSVWARLPYSRREEMHDLLAATDTTSLLEIAPNGSDGLYLRPRRRGRREVNSL
jgi:hypothetical protein